MIWHLEHVMYKERQIEAEVQSSEEKANGASCCCPHCFMGGHQEESLTLLSSVQEQMKGNEQKLQQG